MNVISSQPNFQAPAGIIPGVTVAPITGTAPMQVSSSGALPAPQGVEADHWGSLPVNQADEFYLGRNPRAGDGSLAIAPGRLDRLPGGRGPGAAREPADAAPGADERRRSGNRVSGRGTRRVLISGTCRRCVRHGSGLGGFRPGSPGSNGFARRFATRHRPGRFPRGRLPGQSEGDGRETAAAKPSFLDVSMTSERSKERKKHPLGVRPIKASPWGQTDLEFSLLREAQIRCREPFTDLGSSQGRGLTASLP